VTRLRLLVPIPELPALKMDAEAKKIFDAANGKVRREKSLISGPGLSTADRRWS
jgi:hypothetical protein